MVVYWHFGFFIRFGVVEGFGENEQQYIRIRQPVGRRTQSTHKMGKMKNKWQKSKMGAKTICEEYRTWLPGIAYFSYCRSSYLIKTAARAHTHKMEQCKIGYALQDVPFAWFTLCTQSGEESGRVVERAERSESCDASYLLDIVRVRCVRKCFGCVYSLSYLIELNFRYSRRSLLAAQSSVLCAPVNSSWHCWKFIRRIHAICRYERRKQ